MTQQRPIVLITGVGRQISIGTEIARQLATDGWDIAFANHSPERGFVDEFTLELHELGAKTLASDTDLADPLAPETLMQAVTDQLGPVRALVASHAQSIDSSIHDTSIESFDRHFAINTRANWLLIKAFAQQYSSAPGLGRIVALTSDHTTHNLPYGASKGALDRIVIAAAGELGHRGITANLINPGPIDTGWISPELGEALSSETALGRLGTQRDAANLVSFLLSERGGWINGQLLHSNGGFHLPV
ncbi:SDR family oxidoreductase [Arthrobacter sp. ES3-54]|uniref:SDR family oxidoreductase n=1 Tax=Arthrobacter sp. ES3-54 TaxID=1502991 RepID=UPI0024060058|nr:SDR family oxidoreductase [Arthrobacter sp. ES3-54]MDF9752262.1 3-oxoacyl-[acyl-carrier protein] reductase [Arthrobacter sp. ES3-54]